MNETELLTRLLDLADEAGLQVRTIRGGAGQEGELGASSATCIVRGEPWIVLATTDSADERIGVVAQALRTYAPELLESRYLPPVVRERLGLPRD